MIFSKLLVILFAFVLFSCTNPSSDIFLPIHFGMSGTEQLNKRDELVNNKTLHLFISDKGDTSYYRDLILNNSPIQTKLKFNYDHLGFGGPLRLYTYYLSTTPYAKSGNDTANVPKWYLQDNNVCLVSSFSTVKSFLDKKFGTSSLITNVHDVLLNKDDTTFKYSLDTIDIYLTHSPIVSSEDYKVQFKEFFYDRAYLSIAPKSYHKEAEKETERRISLLTSSDILEIRFDNAKMKNEVDENGYPRINLTANYEDFKTDLVEADIIEAKGIITCKDMYDDELVSQEVSYKFDPPLVRHGKIGKSREWFMQSFSISPLGDAYPKIYDQLSKGRIVKVNFKPTAVVFEDGTVIK